MVGCSRYHFLQAGRCQEYCAWFSTGKSYQMRNAVNGLECDTGDNKVTLPIVQEDVDFPAEGGKG